MCTLKKNFVTSSINNFKESKENLSVVLVKQHESHKPRSVLIPVVDAGPKVYLEPFVIDIAIFN